MFQFKLRRLRPSATIASAATILSLTSVGCEDDMVAPNDDGYAEGTISVDATSHTAPVYVSLATGAVVTPSDPASSTEWQMGFRRFSAHLNGGVSGPGTVAGVGVGNNASATAEEVAAFTEAVGDSAFLAVTADDIPGASSFAEDDLAPDPGASWFRFDGRLGTLVANPGAAWKTQESSNRGHAAFRVTSLVMEGQRPVGLVVEYRRQDPGGALGEARTVEASLARGPAYFALAQGQALGPGQVQGPGACAWDIAATPALEIQVNADCGAGTFPLDPREDFTALARADDAPKYGGFLAAISGTFPATVDDATGAFWYNIEGNNRMWPTYNVFLVRADEAVYKVQVPSYYDAAGTSAVLTVRYQQLR